MCVNIIDIDECSDPVLNECEVPGSCVNHLGTYTCGCNSGYEINAGGRNCDGECKLIIIE